MPKSTPLRIIDGATPRYSGAVAAGIGGGSVATPDHGTLPGLADDDHPHYLTQPRGDALYVPLTRSLTAGAGLAGGGTLAGNLSFAVNVAAPLAITDDIVGLTYGTGLTLSGGALIADIGAGLAIAANKTVVDYDATLGITGNDLGVALAYDFPWTGSHTWAEGEGLRSYGTVTVPGLTPGYGWSITNPGGDAALSIPNIWVGNLHAQAFILDTARVDVGEEIWARSRATLYAAFTTPAVSGTASLIVEVPPGVDGSVFHLFGDSHYVRVRVLDTTRGLLIADAWGTVVYTSYTAGGAGLPARQTYTFTMLYGAEGATIPAGALVLGYGLPGDSFVLLTTLKPGSPYTDYIRWGMVAGAVDAGAVPWDGSKYLTLTRIGNLTGIQDSAFSASPLTGAGLYGTAVYLKGQLVLAGSAPTDPGASGLYAYGDALGFWDGTVNVWKAHLDNTGSFIFTNQPASEGATRLKFDSDTSHLGGQVFKSGTWRPTWYADANDGVFYAGELGEVMLHDFGVSLVGYTAAEINPVYNTKSLAFFDTQANAKTNDNMARARVWGGWDVTDYASGSPWGVKSMLQMEIGVGTEGRIDSGDRPHIAMMYMPNGYAFKQERWLEARGFDYIELDATVRGGGDGLIVLNAPTVAALGMLQPYSIMPHQSGSKVIGTSENPFTSMYVTTLHAGEVIAPTFTGQNTMGAEVSVTALYHNQPLIITWTEVRDDGTFFSGGASDRLVADVSAWYFVSLSLTASTDSGDQDIWIKVNNTTDYFKSHTVNKKATIGGYLYLAAGSYIQGYLDQTGAPGITARMSIVRTGTMGASPTTSIWTAAGSQYIRSTQASTSALRVENSSVGHVMDLYVTGGIHAGTGVPGTALYNEVDIEALSADFRGHLSATDPHPQYVLESTVVALYATQDALEAAVFEAGGGGTPVSHNSLTNLDVGDYHPQYVHLSVARTITGVHTFAPASTTAPFALGTNALGQLVTGLNADLFDGHHWSEITIDAASILTRILTVDGPTSGLNADLLDDLEGTDYARSATAVSAGDGLLGGGTLAAPFGISLNMPGTLTVATTNDPIGNHTHAVTSSSNPGAAASLLATNASGYTQLTRLGVGVAPSSLLHLASNMQLDRSFYMDAYLAGSDAYSQTFQKSRSATIGQFAAVQAGDRLGVINFAGSSDTAFVIGASIRGLAEAAFTGTYLASYLAFYTSDGASTHAQRWRITSTGIWQAAAAQTIQTITGDLTIAAASGSIILNPSTNLVNLATGKALQTTGFTSGWVGNGGRLDDGIAVATKTSLEVDELTVRGRMRVYETLINQIRTTNGSLFVSSSAKALTVSAPVNYDFTITTEFAHGFLVNDFVRAQRFTGTAIYICDLHVITVGSTTSFVGTLQADKDAPTVGMTFVRIGSVTDVSRRGTVYLTSDDSGAPYIDVVDGVDSVSQWNAPDKVKVRLGKLTGITGSANEYGLYAGNDGFGITKSYVRISNLGVLLINTPIKMYNASNQTVNIDAAGTDIWVGPSVSDKRLSWDGSIFAVVGAITANTGYIGTAASGWSIASGQLTSTNIGLYAGAANTARLQVGTGNTANTAGVNATSAAGDIAFWAGATHANRASAPIMITAAGALTATNATVTGVVTASGGEIKLDSGGMKLYAAPSGGYSRSINWVDNVTSPTLYVANMGAYINTVGGTTRVFGISNTSYASNVANYISILAEAAGGVTARIELNSTSVDSTSYVYLTGGNIHLKGNAAVTGQMKVGELTGANPHELLLTMNTSGLGYGSIQAVQQGINWSPLILNLQGGGVGIGTASVNASVKLHVVGTIYADTVRSDTVYTGACDYWGAGHWWNIRTATDGSFKIDTYYSGMYKEVFHVGQDGIVGIGTASPINLLSGTKGMSVYHVNTPGIAWGNSTTAWLAYMSGATFRIFNYPNDTMIMSGLLTGFGGPNVPTHVLEIDAGANSYTTSMQLHGTGADMSFALKNTGTGGRDIHLISTSGASGAGQGTFRIYDNTNSADLFGIQGRNLHVGGSWAVRATTVGNGCINIYNATAPAGTLSNGGSIYCTGGELYMMDAAGNTTLQTPHDDDGYWIFRSKNTVTHRVLKIDMERMLMAINEKFGWDFISEYIEE